MDFFYPQMDKFQHLKRKARQSRAVAMAEKVREVVLHHQFESYHSPILQRLLLKCSRARRFILLTEDWQRNECVSLCYWMDEHSWWEQLVSQLMTADNDSRKLWLVLSPYWIFVEHFWFTLFITNIFTHSFVLWCDKTKLNVNAKHYGNALRYKTTNKAPLNADRSLDSNPLTLEPYFPISRLYLNERKSTTSFIIWSVCYFTVKVWGAVENVTQ